LEALEELNAPNIFGFTSGPLGDFASLPVFDHPNNEDATVTAVTVAKRAAAPTTLVDHATGTDYVFSAAHVDSGAPLHNTGQAVEFSATDRALAASNGDLADLSALASFLGARSLHARRVANSSPPSVAPLAQQFSIQIDTPQNLATVPHAGFAVTGHYDGTNGPVLIDVVLTYVNPKAPGFSTGKLPPEDPPNKAFNRMLQNVTPTAPGQRGLLTAFLYDDTGQLLLAPSPTIQVTIT
jgi:hypothetical protein